MVAVLALLALLALLAVLVVVVVMIVAMVLILQSEPTAAGPATCLQPPVHAHTTKAERAQIPPARKRER